jgi:hypothetical protein
VQRVLIQRCRCVAERHPGAMQATRDVSGRSPSWT